MAEIKLTKNELRTQQNRLTQLQKYLPTLQLKKAMLQLEVNEARLEILRLKEEYQAQKQKVEQFAPLLSEVIAVPIQETAQVQTIHKRYENVAGVNVPYYEGIDFNPIEYSLFDTPSWVDPAIDQIRFMIESLEKVKIAEEKKEHLEKELREVSIRVNLFEKILIPRALSNIKKIKVFLGDQQLAAVSQAKVAKAKIEANK